MRRSPGVLAGIVLILFTAWLFSSVDTGVVLGSPRIYQAGTETRASSPG